MRMEDVMPRDKTVSHVKIMAAAREEFMEYGFGKVSIYKTFVGERREAASWKVKLQRSFQPQVILFSS